MVITTNDNNITMKAKAIIAAMLLLVCATVSAQNRYMNVKTADGKYVSFRVTPDLQVTWDGTAQGNPITNALPGKFKVSDSKSVYFSKGNLYYDGSTFAFEDSQYSISASWSATHVSNFFWSASPTVACADSYSDAAAKEDDVLFTNDADFTVAGQKGVWFTLSADEWLYLFQHYAYKYVNVCGKSGIVIAPSSVEADAISDTYEGAAWAAAEAQGFVFLPNTGFRTGKIISETHKSCIYWTCNTKGNTTEARREFFQMGSTLSVELETSGLRYWGVGIRLVTTQNDDISY